MSLSRLEEHRRLWATKPLLARVYRPWFEILLALAPPGARVLEIGAGPGLLAAFARRERPDLRWIASDLHAASWNDLAADATRLPLRTACVEQVVGVDVLHHLPRPAEFFSECARVLVERGSLALVEPWVTPLSWPVYGLLHQEGCDLRVDPWRPFRHEAKDSFEGDAAVPRQLVRTATTERWRSLGLAPPRVQPINAFAYLLSLGFRRGSLLPKWLARPMLAADRAAAPLARWTGLRASLHWRRL